MSHHKKQKKCSCEKKYHKELKKKCVSSTLSTHVEYPNPSPCQKYKKYNEYKNSGCNCEQNLYFPLPALPSQPIKEKLSVGAWFAPGTVESCCSICSTIKPVYLNPYNVCKYNEGYKPINNSAYYTTNQYVY